MNNSTLEALRALYERLPKLQCKGECFASCGPVAMSALERDVVVQRAGERDLDAETWQCGYLDRHHRCEVYSDRPLICRLYGAIEDVPMMRCPHGCEPDRWLTDAEAQAMLRAVETIGGGAAYFGWRSQIIASVFGAVRQERDEA